MTDRSLSGVRSVQHALDVLEHIAFSGEELGVTQLAERLALTKGSVHRHLLTLVERGYVAQNPLTTRYGVGPKCRLLGRSEPQLDLARLAEDAMRDLRDELGHTVVLSAMSPRGALVLSTLASTSPIEIGVRPGSELPFHAAAQGRVLLAFAPRRLQERILDNALESYTAKTVADRNAVAQELDRIVARGFASAAEQVILGINAIAVPVFDAADVCVGALAVVGSIQYLPHEPPAATVSSLTKAAQQISRRIGQTRPREIAAQRSRPRSAPARAKTA
jgi:DNA-binding IclR family transcriptional regulator